MAAPTVALIGGTGPTGPLLAAGLEARGHEVTVVHTGAHEIDEVAHREHVHLDVRSLEALTELFASRGFDLCLATYGRLRAIAEATAGRVGRFVSIGGVPAYRGFFDAGRFDPPGMPVPTAEDAPTADTDDDGKSYRIRRTEEVVYAHHPDATHFRYPYLYGPRQPVPREWCIVRRVLDGRRHLVVPDGGLALQSFASTANAAHAVLLAVDRPDAAQGEIFNVADLECLTLAQVVDLVAGALGAELEQVSIPAALAWPARPLMMQQASTHRVVDLGKLVHRLGYTDVVPARQGVTDVARWLAEHPPEPGGVEERVLEDPFDYAAEDELISHWRAATATVVEPTWENAAPGYGLHYAGPGATYQRPDTRI